MKKILMILAVLAMLAPAALAVTPATPIYECEGYTYILQADGTAKIVCWDGREAALTVPGELDGFAVTAISECAFADCPALESIALPESVTSIGERAFMGCVSLGRVDLPEGLLSIGSRAFDHCEALLQVELPMSLVEMGDNPFRGCANLYDIRIAEGHPYLQLAEGALLSRPDHRLICFPMGLTTPLYRVPEGVEIIGANAFEQDLYIEEIVLPESVTAIGQAAFDGCEALKAMNLPASVQTIGEAAMRCRNLEITLEGDDLCPPQLI